MFCAGGTLGAARKPFYRKGNNTFSMLPRPYKNNLPFHSGFNLLKEFWVNDFFKDVEKLALQFIYFCIPDCKQKTILQKYIEYSKSLVPDELRISNTFFTQLSLIGDMSYQSGLQDVRPHVDADDIFTAIIHLGHPIKGGNLVIYSGNSKKNCGQIIKKCTFKHGNIHFGCFMNVVHAVEPWYGHRGSFSLNLKKSMVNYFKDESNSCHYTCYKNMNYPNQDHFIIN